MTAASAGARGGVVAATAARAAWLELRRQLGDEQARERGAAVVGQALGRLRGVAAKLAQIASMETGLLPPEYEDVLRTAHYAAPTMARPQVRRVVTRELGAPPERRFATFEWAAFAAASLGQVHRATLRDGRAVAVKVQYPSMRHALHSDFAALRAASRLLPEARYLASALDELQARIAEELDYRTERAHLAWFRARLDVPGVALPAPVPALCTGALLTTTLLPGVHPDQWAGPQEATDAAAARLVAVFRTSLFTLGRLHADPNLGNVLLQDGGAVGILDFGCVKVVPEAVRDAKAALTQALLAGDDRGAMAAYRSLGLFGPLGAAEAAALRDQALRPLEAWLTLPLRVPRFDFAAHPGFCALGRQAFRRVIQDRARLRMHPDLLFVDRTQYGLLRLFDLLGARVDLRPLLAPPTQDAA